MSVQGPWWLRLPVCIAMGVYTLMSLVSFSTGIDAKAVRAEVKRRALGRCLAREQKRTGLSLLMQAPERCETADEPMDTDP
jgi:hypothetical protein